jgi:chromosome segregation ATPase
MQDILKKQAEDEIAEIKQRYIGELSFSTLEREEKTRLINKAMGRVRKLRIEKKDKEDKFKKEKDSLERSLKNHEDDIQETLSKISEIQALLEEQKENENCERERFSMIQADQEALMEKLNKEEAGLNQVFNKAEYLKTEVVKYMDLKSVKKNLCVVCNNVLASEIPEDFKEIKAGKGNDEISRNICTCRIS